MKKYSTVLLTAIILYSCSTDKTYNLDTLNSDIKKFESSDQRRIIEFSNRYEKLKELYDSIDGVPVVLAQSLTYPELLEKIKANEDKLLRKRIDFSLNLMETLNKNSEQVDTIVVSTLESPVLVFTQDVLVLPSEIMLSEGRAFSQFIDHGSDVAIISRSIADKQKLEIDDIISLDKDYKIIGITTNVDIIRPYEPTYFIIRTII